MIAVASLSTAAWANPSGNRLDLLAEQGATVVRDSFDAHLATSGD